MINIEVRLQKYLADCGVASRRKSEQLILDNLIKVNGNTVNTLGIRINPEIDIVQYNGVKLSNNNEKTYILLNKPTDCVTTAKDQFGRKTVIDLLTDIKERVYPVGRLDYDTSGLLLLTNDGELTHKLTHPKNNINKTYLAKVAGVPNEQSLINFRNGLLIEDYKTSNAKIKIVNQSTDNSILEIIIHEGKNRQIRKMCEKIGHPVLKLKRISIENISIGNLKTAEYRKLSKEELTYLKDL